MTHRIAPSGFSNVYLDKKKTRRVDQELLTMNPLRFRSYIVSISQLFKEVGYKTRAVGVDIFI
jgi:hypothetical protein